MVCSAYMFLGFLLFCFYSMAQSQLNETTLTTDTQCYGSGLVVNATCPVSSSIAFNIIRVGTRPTTHGCLGNETTGDGTGCCETSSDACEFDYPLFDYGLYQTQCNGKQFCQLAIERVDVIHGSCNTSVYPGLTQYMYLNYFCIDESRIGDMENANLTVENATLYLQSPRYPTLTISSSVSELSCSVETDNCHTSILIYVIERDLESVMNSTSTQCNQTQSLSIIEEDGNTLVNWTCNDNTYTISQPLQTAGNYILVNLTNTMTADGGRFWIGFKAFSKANLTLKCPAQDKQHCVPLSTASGSTNTVTITISSPSAISTTESSSTTTSSTTITSTTGSTFSTTSTSPTFISPTTTTTTSSSSTSIPTTTTPTTSSTFSTTSSSPTTSTTLTTTTATSSTTDPATTISTTTTSPSTTTTTTSSSTTDPATTISTTTTSPSTTTTTTSSSTTGPDTTISTTTTSPSTTTTTTSSSTTGPDTTTTATSSNSSLTSTTPNINTPSTTTTTTSSTTTSHATTTNRTSPTSSTNSTSSSSSTSTTSTPARNSSITTRTTVSNSFSTQRTATTLTTALRRINTTPRNNNDNNNKVNRVTTLKDLAAVYGPLGFIVGMAFLIGLNTKGKPRKKKKDPIKSGNQDQGEPLKHIQHSSGGSDGAGANTQSTPKVRYVLGDKIDCKNETDAPPPPKLLNGPVIRKESDDYQKNTHLPSKLSNGPRQTNNCNHFHKHHQPRLKLSNTRDGSIFCPRYYGHLNRIYPSVTEEEIIREAKRSGLVRAINFLTFRHQRQF